MALYTQEEESTLLKHTKTVGNLSEDRICCSPSDFLLNYPGIPEQSAENTKWLKSLFHNTLLLQYPVNHIVVAESILFAQQMGWETDSVYPSAVRSLPFISRAVDKYVSFSQELVFKSLQLGKYKRTVQLRNETHPIISYRRGKDHTVSLLCGEAYISSPSLMDWGVILFARNDNSSLRLSSPEMFNNYAYPERERERLADFFS